VVDLVTGELKLQFLFQVSCAHEPTLRPKLNIYIYISNIMNCFVNVSQSANYGTVYFLVEMRQVMALVGSNWYLDKYFTKSNLVHVAVCSSGVYLF
jgi:hypothetical protein